LYQTSIHPGRSAPNEDVKRERPEFWSLLNCVTLFNYLNMVHVASTSTTFCNSSYCLGEDPIIFNFYLKLSCDWAENLSHQCIGQCYRTTGAKWEMSHVFLLAKPPHQNGNWSWVWKWNNWYLKSYFDTMSWQSNIVFTATFSWLIDKNQQYFLLKVI